MHELTLREMLDYAMLAYSDTPTSRRFKAITLENCKCGVQFFIGKNDKGVLLIAFRGTDSIQDFKTDLRFWTKSVPYGKKGQKMRVHSGFYDAYNNPEVSGKIATYITSDVDSVYITGHSYGGALALLCALDLQEKFPDNAYEVAVFGCPRVGNKAFAKAYNKRLIKTISVRHGNDLVTKIPPAMFGFRHAGIAIHIGFPRIFGLYSAKNHQYGKYYARLWKSR